VKDYGSMLDPRLAVQRIADAVAGRGNYSLKFANSFSTYNYASSSLRSFGCNSTYRSAFSARYYDPLYFDPYDYMDITPLFWSGWGMPSWYVMSWSTPRLGGCPGYAMTYNRILWSPSYGQRHPGLDPILNPDGTTGTPVTPILTRLRPVFGDSLGRAAKTGGRSAIDRHTIVTRARPSTATTEIGRIVERLVRPDRRSVADFNSESLVRTHAASFDRPGTTRVLDERSYRRHAFGPLYPVNPRTGQADDYRVWMTDRSSRTTDSWSGGTHSRPTTAASGSSGSSVSSGSSSTAASAGSRGAGSTDQPSGRKK
jgi:hypothetical protein